MIEIGYKFPHNGAVVLATSPADSNSIIVLCKEPTGSGRVQWITGRVYAHQLPHPESWDSGTYSGTIERAVEHFIERSGLEGTPDSVRYLASLIRNTEAAQADVTKPSDFVQLFEAIAACEAPEGSQIDNVLASFQARYFQQKENR